MLPVGHQTPDQIHSGVRYLLSKKCPDIKTVLETDTAAELGWCNMKDHQHPRHQQQIQLLAHQYLFKSVDPDG